MISRLAEFLAVLSPGWRDSYLPLLNDLLGKASKNNWRLRESLAVQLAGLVSLFRAEIVHLNLAPLSLEFLRDSVSAVRSAAVQVGLCRLFYA